MSKKSAPAPDYTGAAAEQGKASQELATQQNYANRPTVNTPWGQQTWSTSEGIDPSTGQKVTNWTQNNTLDPRLQSALDSQLAIQEGRSGAAQTLLDQATAGFKDAPDWGSLSAGGDRVTASGSPQLARGSAMSFGSSPGASSAYRQKAQDAITQLQAPELARAREATAARLAAQGITAGSDAYNAEMRSLADNESRANLMAISAGRDEANMAYSQDLSTAQFQNQTRGQDSAEELARTNQNNQAMSQNLQNQIQAGGYNQGLRSQQIAEMVQKRGMSLNELNALLTGQQVSMPSVSGTGGAVSGKPADMTSAMANQYQAAQGQANAQNAETSGTWGAVGTAAVMAMMYY